MENQSDRLKFILNGGTISKALQYLATNNSIFAKNDQNADISKSVLSDIRNAMYMDNAEYKLLEGVKQMDVHPCSGCFRHGTRSGSYVVVLRFKCKVTMVLMFGDESTNVFMESGSAILETMPDVFYSSPAVTQYAQTHVSVHQGFKSMYTELAPFVESQVQNSLGNQCEYFIVAGYSIGGALANIASVHIAVLIRELMQDVNVVTPPKNTKTYFTDSGFDKVHMNLITFGAPSTGNRYWNEMIVASTLNKYDRYTIEHDPVPQSPSTFHLFSSFQQAALPRQLHYDIGSTPLVSATSVTESKSSEESKDAKEKIIVTVSLPPFKSRLIRLMYGTASLLRSQRLYKSTYRAALSLNDITPRDVESHALGAYVSLIK